MRPHLRSLLLAAAALVAAAVLVAGCGSSEPPARTAYPGLQSQLQRVVDAGSPGAIGLVNDGSGVELHAAGVADTRSGRRLRPTDRFRIGSNTKTFVAVVALQLVHDGRLSLTDTVEHWLPGLLPYGDRINLRQLLNMTAGVPDYVPELEAEMDSDPDALRRTYSPRELVARVARRKPDFAPDAAWHYSSTGYIIAGLIIERASGHDLGDELQRRIFAPLHLRHTSLPLRTSAIPGAHANGYGLVGSDLRDLSGFNASAAWATGGIVSTAPDVARFWHALLGGRLLAPAQLAAMKTTVPVGGGYPGRYGLGLMRWTQYAAACGVVWGNGGDLPGFSSEFLNSEDGKRQAGVVVNVNPIPKAVAGEPLGQSKRTALAEALGHEHC